LQDPPQVPFAQGDDSELSLSTERVITIMLAEKYLPSA
jgi:hypothetical protein